MPSGDVLLTFETFKEYDEAGPWREKSGTLRSRDDGRTWREQVIVGETEGETDGDADPHETMWFDPRIGRLSDGRLVTFFYAFRHRTTTDGPNHVAWSRDDGLAWSKPAPTSLWGQATYPIPLEAGRLVVFQQRRTDPQTMVACYSADGGATFDVAAESAIYRHQIASASAPDGSIGSQEYLMSMARFTFGHPCGVALGADRVLVAWYAGSVAETAIHVAELRVRG